MRRSVYLSTLRHDRYRPVLGISIFLWDNIAEQLGLDYSIEQYGLKEMLEAVAQGKADIAISCRSITKEREEIVDFSHSFYETLSVLPFVSKKQNYGFALPDDSPHLEKLNQALLSVRDTPEWKVEIVKYIGK